MVDANCSYSARCGWMCCTTLPMASSQSAKQLATRPPRSEVGGKRFDLGAALNDPAAGAAWDWPLRLIARFHCAMDVDAPVCFRVSRQFEYCWRLAVQTNNIDVSAHQRAARAWTAQNYTGPPPTVPFAVKHIVVSSRREAKKNAHLCKGFEVTRITESGSANASASRARSKEIRFLGPMSWRLPPDAVLVGPAALFL